jgi:molybdopterin molybdotransferase
MISLAEALGHITASRAEWGVERVPLVHSVGRVLAEDVAADREYPPFDRATMDGFAVRTDDLLRSPGESYRVIGTVFAGDDALFTLHAGDAVKIMTGAPVPESADAVIKKEEADDRGGVVRFRAAEFTRHQNIARKGEDSRKDEQVLAKGVRIESGQLAVLAAVGKSEVQVVRIPRVAVLSTGNELQPVTGTVAPHQIRDSNGWAIAGFLRRHAIEPMTTVIVRDTLEDLTRAIASAIDCDILIMSGGVSAGDADLVPQAMTACGIRNVFHRVKIKPGKPLWFGTGADGIRVFALPGNPFSVQTACRIFIEPYIRVCLHLPPGQPLRLPLHEARKKKTALDEFFPAAMVANETTHVAPLSYTTSGNITATVGSDGIALHPAGNGDLKKDETVDLYLWNT